MNYSKLINQELKCIAKRVPYNKATIIGANIFEAISLKLFKTPKDVICSRFPLNGYKNLPFNVEMFEPLDSSENLPCLIYIHGGAFSYKASLTCKKLAYMYALKANCKVIFPDYHLTPKYPFPAAYNDVLAVYKHILANSNEMKIDTTRIGVAGDSAGASIAALICNSYERENVVPPCLQMLIYPVLDATMSTESMKKYTDTPLWNSVNNKKMWIFYLKEIFEENLILASPMQNQLPKLIPNTYIETAEYDCLHDEGILYAEKLKQANANVKLNETIGTIHGYDSALNTKIVQENINKRIEFLNSCFKSIE